MEVNDLRKIALLSLLTLSLALPAGAVSTDDPVKHFIHNHYGLKKAEAYAPIIHQKAKKYRLPPLLIARIIKLESDFNPRERSGRDAMGLMQVRAGHARRGENLYDPATNVDFGCRILREYVDEFDGNMHKGLSAYLHGPIYVASRGVSRTRYSRKLLGE